MSEVFIGILIFADIGCFEKPKPAVRWFQRLPQRKHMKQFTATVAWARNGQPFADNRYSRAHQWEFDGGARVPGSSSPLSVPLPMSDPTAVDPEEALVAALSSCHMLFFLSIAQQAGFIVNSYRDAAVGTMDRDANGKLAMTAIALRPVIAFEGRQPGADELASIHHSAHDKCYIANSIKAEVVIEGAPAHV
jgi:organic hydroperoxide reductase OsmC/OhrA